MNILNGNIKENITLNGLDLSILWFGTKLRRYNFGKRFGMSLFYGERSLLLQSNVHSGSFYRPELKVHSTQVVSFKFDGLFQTNTNCSLRIARNNEEYVIDLKSKIFELNVVMSDLEIVDNRVRIKTRQ